MDVRLPPEIDVRADDQLMIVDAVRRGDLVIIERIAPDRLDVRAARPDDPPELQRYRVDRATDGAIEFVRHAPSSERVQFVLLCRDAAFSPAVLAAYQPGRVLREPGLWSGSRHIGGFVRPHRLLAAVRSARSLESISVAPDEGEWIVATDRLLLVLDRIEADGRVQVLLVEVAALDERLVDHGARELVAIARRFFEDARAAPPVPALTDDAWCEKTAIPVGVTESGEPILPAGGGS
jgi:hypothetical protein